MARRKRNVPGMAGTSSTNENTHRSSRRRSKPTKFSMYIYKVLKQVHPELSMTNKAMKVMDDFMHDIYTRLVEEAAGLVKFSKKSTLSASEFQTATRLILPGELAKHAVSDATKAVASFMKSRSDETVSSRARQSRVDTPGIARVPINIEILRPDLSSSERIQDIDESHEEPEPMIRVRDQKTTEDKEMHNEAASRKRKAPEVLEEEQAVPVAGASTPKKSPKLHVPADRRPVVELSLETPHKEDKPIDESEGEEPGRPVEDEPAPPTPPPEEESNESSNESLPNADESALDVEERNVSNVTEPEASIVALDATVDVNDEEPSFPAATENGHEAQVLTQKRVNVSIEELSVPAEEENEGQRAQVLTQEQIEEEGTEATIEESRISTREQTILAAQEPTSAGEAVETLESEPLASSEEIASDKATRGTETDSETVVMDMDTSVESEDPLVTVRVQVDRRREPKITSNISIFERTAEGVIQESVSESVSENAEPDTSTTENDANHNTSLIESQPSILSDDSDLATYTRSYTASCLSSEAASKTVVTVKCSKITTTKTVVTHERKEQVSEWITETEK